MVSGTSVKDLILGSSLRGQHSDETSVLLILTFSDLCPAGVWNVPVDSRYVTLTGTITRGKKKGQMVDIHVTLTEKELQELTKPKASSREMTPGGREACQLGADRGPHVVL